jgi:hypothetical protein
MFQDFPTGYVVILPNNSKTLNRLQPLQCIFMVVKVGGCDCLGRKQIRYMFVGQPFQSARREWIFWTMLWLRQLGCDLSSDGIVKRMQFYLLFGENHTSEVFRLTFVRQLFTNLRHVSESVLWKSKIVIISVILGAVSKLQVWQAIDIRLRV